MKTRYFVTLIFVGFLLMTPFLNAVRAHRTTSNYGSGGQYVSEVFGYPPVQYPNGTITSNNGTTTVEVCNDTDGDSCAHNHAFIYLVQLPQTDSGTVISVTLTVNGQYGAIFADSPTWGVLICDPNGAPAPCSPSGAPLTTCADSNNFVVNETGIGTSTYSQTWNFAGCPPFVAGQVLAIFLDLCTPANSCPYDGTPVIDYQDGAGVLVSVGVSRAAQLFSSVTSCRLVDTRKSGGPIWGGTFRNFIIPQEGGCNIPSTATAYSLNVTAVPLGRLGYLTVFPTGEGQPLVSTLNSLDGRVKANAAIVPAGDQDGISIYASDTTDVVLDIDGYFVPPGDSTLAFYPLTPCRVLDTRNPNGLLGGPYLQGGTERDFPVLASNCQVPSGAQAYSMNFTVVPYNDEPLGYLTVWPQGSQQPGVSTLNNLTATIVANAAIVPAGTGGGVAVYPSADTQLVADIDGYFAPAGQGGLSLYPVVPCRVLDTRQVGGAFSGKLTVNVAGSVCPPPSDAQAYVFNATVVPQGALGYLTLWPDSEHQPVVSTLNAIDGAITSNMAIVPNIDGSTDAYATNPTQLILDISGYFAP